MKVNNEFKLEFPSCSKNESFARAVVASFVSQLDPTLDELNDIKTAVSEAVTNCIVHAYPESIGKISVKGKLIEDHTVLLTIKDWGCGIPDIEQAREPMFTTGNEERSGMGFTIMESFMHQVRVTSKVGRGTSVSMRRKIMKRGV